MCFGQSILYIYIEGNYQYICSYSHFINSFEFVLIDLFSYFALLFSYDLMTFVMHLNSFFFWVCISMIMTSGLWWPWAFDTAVYIYVQEGFQLLISSFPVHFECPACVLSSSRDYWFWPLVCVRGWCPTSTLCLPLLVSPLISSFSCFSLWPFLFIVDKFL